MGDKAKRGNRVAIWATVAVVAVVVLGSAGVGLWLRSEPDPLTGDYYADRACAAAVVSPLLDVGSGRPTIEKFMMMDQDTRREWVAGVVDESQYSELPEIQAAGSQLALSVQVSDGSPMAAVMFMNAVGSMADACSSNGWTACAAGLITEGCVATPPR